MPPKKGSKKRRYSDDEKATILLAVDANQGNVKGTAEKLGIPTQTVDYWKHGNVHQDVLKIQQSKIIPLADRLEEIAHEILDTVPEKYENCNLQQAMTSVAIAIDKMRLLREQPTTIAAKQTQDEQLLHQLQRLGRSIRESQSVDGPDSPALPAAEAGASPITGPAGSPSQPAELGQPT